jgi:hypothetical protein
MPPLVKQYIFSTAPLSSIPQDHIHPSDVVLPGVPLRYSLNAQLMWLKQEAAELCQVRLCLYV